MQILHFSVGLLLAKTDESIYVLTIPLPPTCRGLSAASSKILISGKFRYTHHAILDCASQLNLFSIALANF